MPRVWTSSSPTPSRLRQRLRQQRAAGQSRPGHADPPALVPVILPDAELGPALERRLLPTVTRANAGCREARDALHLAFRPKLQRFVRRITVPRAGQDTVGLWDIDDVEQEAWLVFDELIRQWTPDRPFGRYVLATFPWRLRDAVYRGIARAGVPPRMTTVPIGEREWLQDGSAAADEAHVLLDALAARLPALQGTILRRHVGCGETLTEIARDLDVSRSTVTRQWRALRDDLASGFAATPQERHMA
ncbi:MAG TPA: sigma-70 family RNA polymerase sigma factor [Thermomicrobiales bacterium]|nr:sigma-70 family RNA polymerase sigma factor [Thermomicrobiales bacterium]